MASEPTGPRATEPASPAPTALIDAALALTGELDLGRVREAIVAQACALLDPQAVALFTPAPDRSAYVIGAQHGLPAAYVATARVAEGDLEAAAAHAAEGLYAVARGGKAPRWARELLRAGHGGRLIILPLGRHGRFDGLLALLCRPTEGAPAPVEADLAAGLARLAGRALANAQRYREAELGTAETTFLLQIGQLLSSTFDAATIAAMVVAEAADLMESDLCALYLYDPLGQELELLALHGAAQAAAPQRLALERLPTVQTEAPHGRAVTSEAPGEGDLLGLLDAGCQARAAATVPLRARGSLLGLLFLARRDARRYTLQDRELGLKLASLAALALDNARLYANLSEQMEELRSAQAQLIEAEKMASLGRIVAGVAHGLNNPLATVSGYAQLLLDGDVPEEMRGDLERIDRGARRAAEIVRELLSFARQRPVVPAPIDIGDMVNTVLAREEPALTAVGIRVLLELAEGLPRVRGDRNQLEQMLGHLVVNARQAMAGRQQGGTLTLSASHGEGVLIAVRDDGPGIPPELLDKVFEPFLTTHQVGQGTGLGLAVCYGVVHAHGGRISVANNRDGGTTVYVELPAST